MMSIRKMGMNMHHRLVPMPVGVLCIRGHQKFMAVLAVFVMNMLMTVLHRLVDMFMLMPFGQMQPDT